MCGIFGYVGKKEIVPTLVQGLKRLEYRGYDSAGVAFFDNREIRCVKKEGRVKVLQGALADCVRVGGGIECGISHTRWSTHGEPSDINAHPHFDCRQKIFVVHNGIIENYATLKKKLINRDHIFRSETDTEVLAHLMEEVNGEIEGGLENVVQKALSLVSGAYGLGVISTEDPQKIVAARLGSPLVLGVGEEEWILASDPTAILPHTRKVIYMDDGEMAVIDKEGFRVLSLELEEKSKDINIIEWQDSQIQKGGYETFMLKEINEQPQVIKDAIRGRTLVEKGLSKLGGLEDFSKQISQLDRIVITACGTACYAGMVGQYLLEEVGGISCQVEFAHEFHYRRHIFSPKTALLAISQSGETADTIMAVREAKRKGLLTLGIVNVVGSTVARETDAGVYCHAGPEIAVASTKAFTSQIAVLVLLSIFLGRQRKMSAVDGRRVLAELEAIPNKIGMILEGAERVLRVAQKYCRYKNFMFLGRKFNYPVALEGAHKLKELSYRHAEGMPSGELKHGALAMIGPQFPSVIIATSNSLYDKNLIAVEEIKARHGKVIALATAGNEELGELADEAIYLPPTLEILEPLLTVIPLQLLANYTADALGKDVDKPRNLAKSVTVE